MKIMVASDIHGSKFYCGKMIDRFYKEKAEKLVLLGDLYSSNFRNYEEDDEIKMTVYDMLNTISDKLLVVRGNCDNKIDEMLSNFLFLDITKLEVGDNTVSFTHGHKYNIGNVPPNFGDILIYGHLHQGFIIKEDGKIFANPGSVTCPRNGSEHSYIILDENEIVLKNLDGEIIETKKI